MISLSVKCCWKWGLWDDYRVTRRVLKHPIALTALPLPLSLCLTDFLVCQQPNRATLLSLLAPPDLLTLFSTLRTSSLSSQPHELELLLQCRGPAPTARVEISPDDSAGRAVSSHFGGAPVGGRDGRELDSREWSLQSTELWATTAARGGSRWSRMGSCRGGAPSSAGSLSTQPRSGLELRVARWGELELCHWRAQHPVSNPSSPAPTTRSPRPYGVCSVPRTHQRRRQPHASSSLAV
jgi:hypothetical protein